MNILALFSNPANSTRIRVDREDKVLAELSKRFDGQVTIDRVHATEVADIHEYLWDKHYNVIHFSGHGSEEGLLLDMNGASSGGELVNADRMYSLIALAEKSPTLCIFLSCYSSNHIDDLSKSAPFVISSEGALDDRSAIAFTAGFYERYLNGSSISTSFEYAKHLLQAQELDNSSLRLSRRTLIQKQGSKFVKCEIDHQQDPVLVNVDQVIDRASELGIPIEELSYLIGKKLAIHRWIFSTPRERCVIPIGRLLLGEFSWVDAGDVVLCTKLARIDNTLDREHWLCWHRLLVSYNDLASAEYRRLTEPASPTSRQQLQRSLNLFNHHARLYLKPSLDQLESFGKHGVIPLAQFALSHIEMANDYMQIEEYARVVQALEEALTNYHEVVDGLIDIGDMSDDG